MFSNFDNIKTNRSVSFWKVALPKSSYSAEIREKSSMVNSIFIETVV